MTRSQNTNDIDTSRVCMGIAFVVLYLQCLPHCPPQVWSAVVAQAAQDDQAVGHASYEDLPA